MDSAFIAVHANFAFLMLDDKPALLQHPHTT